MPQRKRQSFRLCVAVASVAASLVCDIGFLNHQDARGPKYLKLVLSPREYKNSLALSSSADRVLEPRRGAWYPGQRAAGKVVSLSGEADELLDIISEVYDGKSSFRFLVQRSSAEALYGQNGDSIKEIRRKLKEVHEEEESAAEDIRRKLEAVHDEAEVRIDAENSASPSEVEVVVLKANTAAVHEVAKWILGNQDVQDELSRNLACGYVSGVGAMQSEIFVRLSAKERGHLIGKGGGGVRKLCEEYSVQLDVDNKESTVQISGLAGDVDAFHRHLVQMKSRLAEKELKLEKERELRMSY